MRSASRSPREPSLRRDVALVCVADTVVGLSFGAIAVGAGLPWWLPVLLSLVVFAGGAQLAFVGVLTAGGGPLGALVAGLLINLRHVPFGVAIGDVLAGEGRLRRVLGPHVMTDESVAFVLAQPDGDTDARRRAFWTCGIALFVCWNVGVALGVVAGGLVSDTDAFGLDAMFPAVVLALVLPSLRSAGTRRAALVGALVALAATPLLPAGLGVLAALAGLLAAGRGRPAS